MPLAGVYLLALRVASRLFPEDPQLARLLSPALFVTSLVVPIQLLCRSGCDGFWGNVWLVAVLLGVPGIAWQVAVVRKQGMPRVGRPPRALVLGLLAVLPVAAFALLTQVHDLLHVNGHLPTAAQFVAGHCPPVNQLFPDVPLRYHYGVDILMALLAGTLRLAPSQALDLIVTLAALYVWCCAWGIGAYLFGPQAGPWSALAAIWGGGLAVFATPFLPPDQQLANVLTFGGNYGTDTLLNAPTLSYLFQPPITLGTPVALATLLAALRSTRWRTDLLLLLLLSGLYIIQTVYFAVVLGAVLVHRVLQQRRVLAAVLLVVAVIGIAWMEGGLLFTRLPDPAPRGLAFRFWLGAQGLPVLFWQLLVFGALLPLGLVGLRRARGGRWLFSAYLGACLAAGNFFYYTYSWDIVKFFAVAMPVLGILSGAPLAWLWQRTRIGLVLVAVVLTATSVAYCAAVIWLNVPRPRYDHYLTQQIPRLTPDERGAMIWLHERRRPQDIVAWTGPEASVIAYLSGLSMAGPLQWQGTAFGVSPERIERRAALLDQGATNIPMLRAEGVRWYVTDPDPGSSFARACAATGPSCQLAHRQGIFAIYDLKAE